MDKSSMDKPSEDKEKPIIKPEPGVRVTPEGRLQPDDKPGDVPGIAEEYQHNGVTNQFFEPDLRADDRDRKAYERLKGV